MSKPDCRHYLVEIDNCGITGIFTCVRCGERIVGTAKEVANYRIISHPVLFSIRLSFGLFQFFVVLGTFLFFVSHISEGNRLALTFPLAVMSLVLIGQIVVACRPRRDWSGWLIFGPTRDSFGWLLAALTAITLMVTFILIL